MDNIKISAMTLPDLDSISDILTCEFDDFWNYNLFKSELENKNSMYIVAKLNNQIVGFAGIWFSVDDIHITNIVVKKNCRNQKIGSFKEIEAISRNRISTENDLKKRNSSHYQLLRVRKRKQ